MTIIERESLTELQKIALIQLWNSEYPFKLSLPGLPELEHYLDQLSGKHHLLLIDEHDNLKGWLMYFLRDNEQCFAMLLDSSMQGKGWGSKLLDLAKMRNAELCGWVIDSSSELKQNGENYVSPLGFYLKNRFELWKDIQTMKNGVNGIKVVWRAK